MSDRKTIDINVPVLARVEGEGALDLQVRDGRIEHLALRIFEAPRLFEKFLEGRAYQEIPDMVARICGICPIAYQMSAVQALEGVFGIDPGSWVRAMRRVVYCGEWIQSHALHIHLLAAPDFLGYRDAIRLAEDHPDVVRRGLHLQSLGNDLIRLFGARSVHPVGVCVGGFHHAPSVEAVEAMRQRLADALGQADALVRWTLGLELPDVDQVFASVALRHPDEYPMNEGRIVASDGLDIDRTDFGAHFIERQVPHSTALHCLYHDAPYMVGPLARLNLNHDHLDAPVRELADEGDVQWPSRNPFHGIIARAIEIRYALGEALRLLEGYAPADPTAVAVQPRAGVGFGCTEAPRGILWHRYELSAGGNVHRARIVPPTSQNQARIEDDLRRSLEAFGLDHVDDDLRGRAETVIRNYDPCISCATHFLRVKVERR